MEHVLIQGFKTYTTNTVVYKNVGYAVGDWLMTGATNSNRDSYRVYNCYGHPVTNVKFQTFDDVNKFAELLINKYDEYFILWWENPKADVPGLTRYTIPNGLALYDVFQKFDNKITSYKEIQNELCKFSN